MKVSPQQQIYNTIFSSSLGLGYATFDYLPPKEQKLPFVYVGEQFDQDRRTKTFLFGDVQQTIHIYHDIKGRGELTSMMNELKVELRKLKRTDNFYVTCKQINAQTLTDTTGNTPLLHGIIEAEFTFN